MIMNMNMLMIKINLIEVNNMKITIYELLGMIKDGKAPKKIKIDNSILFLCKIDGIRYRFEKCGFLNWDYYIETDRLDNIVEILDEDFKLKEKKIPEKLIPTSLKGIDDLNEKIDVAHIDTISAIEKINEIIDYLKSKEG